jgi:tetratricopeptide (TPR) repeat protein
VARLFVLAIALAAASHDVSGQSHPSHELPAVAPALLERPITLQSGIGHTHDAVTTNSREAQQFYDQGLAYLHHFEWIDAARSFNQSLRLDGRLALAHVGLSVAHEALNQSAAARAALERARTLAGNVSEHERRHIAIRELQLDGAATPQDSRVGTYRKALDEAIVLFPSDVELWLQRGVAESADITDRGQGSPAGSIRFYERALAVVPDHFAAHHYLTHAYENSGRINDALSHGAAYADAAPAIAHARHMHGHNLRRLGRIEEAIAEFEAANRIERAAFSVAGFRPAYNWHYEHNLDLLGTSYQYTGRMAQAETMLKTAFALPTANLTQAVNKREWLVFLRARGRVDEAMAAAATLTGHPHPVVQAIGHIETGHALLMKRQFKEAAASANAALAAMKRAAAGAGLAAVPFEALQGEFFLRTGQVEKGRAMLESMVKKARAAPGPDEWAAALFTLESIARAAREAGDWEFAARMARQMLEHDNAYAGSHYALALAAEHNGDTRLAASEYALAAKYWARADSGFAELTTVRRKLQKY